MPPADVSVCLITKDEPLLEQALKSIRRYVKQIVVVVTGGTLTPGERALADSIQEFEAKNPEFDNCFDFSLARNRSFELAECTFLMWMDADDVIVGGENLKSELEFLEPQPPLAQLMMPYEYAYDHQGKVTCLLSRERIMRRGVGWRWEEPIHEAIGPIPPDSLRFERPSMVWKHRRTAEGCAKSHARNLTILKAVNAKRPTSRNVYYYGTALYDAGVLDEAREQLVKFTAMTQFEDELHRTYLMLTEIAQRQGKLNDAISWAHKAIECKEKWFESYFALMKCYYARADITKDRRDWERAVHFGEMAKAYPPAKSFFVTLPMERALDYFVWMSRAYDMLGRTQDAFEAAEEGLKADSTNGFLKFNHLLFGVALDRAKLLSTVRRLKERAGKERAVDGLIRTTMEEATRESEGFGFLPAEAPAVAASPKASRVLRAVPERLSIVFACYGVDNWNPEILRGKGVGGGSEVAVVEMATRLAARGHQVTVYGPCPNTTADGVAYQPMGGLDAGVCCDVLFSWRSTWALPKVDTHLKIIWLHDIFAWSADWSGAAPREQYDGADFCLCVSEWQAQNLSTGWGVPREKMVVSRNGVARPERFAFDASTKRQAGKVIWNSSPDRGLEELLEMWPRLKEAAPHAELHIFYGFEQWQRWGYDRERGQRVFDRMKSMEGLGVFYRGRVTQEELAREMIGGDCWFYPNWGFPEVSCVAAMEAQLAGLWIVSSTYAALEETTADCRGVQVFERAEFEQWAKFALKRAKHDRPPLLHAAEARARFSLDTLADEWIELLKTKLAEKCVVAPAGEFNLPPYEGVLP